MPSFFLFPAPPIFRVPLTLASSPPPESREQAKTFYAEEYTISVSVKSRDLIGYQRF